MGRFDAGELALEQVPEVVKAPPVADADIEHWATLATPARIRKSIKHRYGHPKPPPDDAESEPESGSDDAQSSGGGRDWVACGVTDDHRWRIRGEFDLDSAALIGAALVQARERLWERGQFTISEADCLREVAQGFLDGVESPLQRDRSKVWLHLDAVAGTAVTSTGVQIPDAVVDKICCDGVIQPVWETRGVAFNLGRARHSVPERTRRLIVIRGVGCRAVRMIGSWRFITSSIGAMVG